MRDRIERAFESFGRAVYHRALLMLLLAGLGVTALASGLPELQVDTSTESFLKETDPIRLRYEDFRAEFGREERVIIAVEPTRVFDLAFLERLRDLHRDLETSVPMLVEVTSLLNARDTRGRGDELVVEDLFEDWPESREELEAIRARALSNPLYLDQLVDRRETLTTVLIETEAFSSDGAAPDELGGFGDEPQGAPVAARRTFLTGEENAAIVEAIHGIAERYDAPGFRLYVAGSPVLTHYFFIKMREDMLRYSLLAVATIAAVLALLFRRMLGVVLPLAVSALSLLATFGAMGWAGFRIMIPQQVLPSFLLAVGVGGSVHLLVIFFQRLERGASREDAVAQALGHSGLPVAMTGITTAGGLASFSTADLAPISELGMAAPIGVLISLVLTLMLVPAALALLPLRATAGPGGAARRARNALARCGAFATAHARPVVLVAAGVLVLSALGAAQLRFSHAPLQWFPEDDPFRRAAELVDERLRGSVFLELLIDSGRENGLHEPELLNQMDELRRRATALERNGIAAGKAVSLVDVVKEIHQALNRERPEFYAVPQDRRLVAQELLLFEQSGSDDLADFADSRFRRGRMTLKVPFADAMGYPGWMGALETETRRVLGDVPFEPTGLVAMMGRTFNALIHSMARSYLLAFLIITPMMVLLIGNLRIGLLSMVPNLAPILVTLGAMGWLGISLDAFTLMIGGIALGLVVDDTIHFMHNFGRYYGRSGDVPAAVRETLVTTGQALLFTSLVLAIGFLVFTLSSLANLVRFGLLTGFTIGTALLADVVLAPALVSVALGRGRAGGARSPVPEGSP